MSKKCIIEKYLHKARFCGNKTIEVPYNDLTMMCHLALDSLHTSRWIPVSERLHNIYKDVLCLDFGHIEMAYLNTHAKWIQKGIQDGYLENVTHWMPLPNPPEVE